MVPKCYIGIEIRNRDEMKTIVQKSSRIERPPGDQNTEEIIPEGSEAIREITKDEIVHPLKRNKAPGSEDIPMDMISGVRDYLTKTRSSF